MTRHLHMVCLRSPWPADTGGARDILDRLKALHRQGIRVHLHYFVRPQEQPASQLTSYCDSISVYPRNSPWRGIWKGMPFIVACRQNQQLLENLSADHHPILFDGIHTTACIGACNGNGRKMVIRMHNDEVRYYRTLVRFEKNFAKRIYLGWESVRIKKWLKNIPPTIPMACIQSDEAETLKRDYGFNHSFFLPPSIPTVVDSAHGLGGYCLYHGNLSVGENERAVSWLLRRVFAQIKIPLVIAGKSPSKKLQQLIHFYQHACLVANPTDSELHDLIRKAQINILPSLTETGTKLKIFDALQYGRHCVINKSMQVGSPWTDSCIVATDASAMAAQVQRLFTTPFTDKMIRERVERLNHWHHQLNSMETLFKQLW